MQKNIIFLFLTASFSVFAQNELDALRYSNDGLQGTARALGVGGAMSAVGADLSAAALNPAGLGLYQFSDMSMTMMLQPTSENVSYFGGQKSATQSPFFIQSAGMAINGRIFDGHGEAKKKGLKSYNVAFGYQRSETYRSNYQVEGYNRYNSITDYFAQLANGQVDSNLTNINYPEAAAYQCYGINPIANENNQYFGVAPGGGVQQMITSTQTGKKGEGYIALAGNVSDKLYIGARIGFQTIKYKQSLDVSETDINNVHENYIDNANIGLNFPMKSFNYKEHFDDVGSGVNFQFGLIYRPINNLRIGISILSPTKVSFNDQYQFSIQNVFTQNDSNIIKNATSDLLISNYTVKTPYQINMGAAYLMGKYGFLSADVNVKDYSTAMLMSDLDRTDANYYSYDNENAKIRNFLKMTINYRLGGEFRLQNLRFRAGTGAMLSPIATTVSQYQDSADPSKMIAYNAQRRYFTGGIGYRTKEYYLDLAYIHQTQHSLYSPYLLTGANTFTPNVINDKVTQSFVLTMGLSF